jgi:hypothetical protein
LAANGRVRADLVTINGKEERHPEGAYYLEWWEGAKRVRLSVGKDAADASARRLQKEAELNALNHGVAVAQNGNGDGRRSIAVAVTEFRRKSPRRMLPIRLLLDTFTSSRHFSGR